VTASSGASAQRLPAPYRVADEQSSPDTTVVQLRPTIRPVLVSQDPAGDEGISCYVFPQTYPNGFTETPRAVASECVVEVTDLLRIEFSNVTAPATMTINGPDGFATQISDLEWYVAPGMPLGEYTFSADVDGKPVTGGFTVKPSSKKVLQLRYKDPQDTIFDYGALAGYAPNQKIIIYYYEQSSYQPNVGTGTRTWRLGQAMGYVMANDRGEAVIKFDISKFGSKRNFLFVTDPFQESDLNSAMITHD
jgi:hypothetical protein